MNDEIKEKLEKQFELLSERSETAAGVELAELTNAMINLSAVLDSDKQSRFSYAGLKYYPAVLQLPIEDLIALRSAKLELENDSCRYKRA